MFSFDTTTWQPSFDWVYFGYIGTFITGALLLDGLMDSADGLFSGRSKERSLEIMKDSHVGAFGVLSVLLIVLLKHSRWLLLILRYILSLSRCRHWEG